LAGAIFEYLAATARRPPIFTPIISAKYATAARRPANSRLNCAKVGKVYGNKLPHWLDLLDSLATCLERLVGHPAFTSKPTMISALGF
jgi:dTDP-4-dehydrorhamnose reductase